MKPVSGALASLLNNTNTFLMADLLTIAFYDGTFLRLTSADTDLSVGGQTFKAAKDMDPTIPGFERGRYRSVVGLEVDEMDVTLQVGQSVKLGGVSMARAAINGAFDGATVTLQRLFMPAWGDESAGTVMLFEGQVAGVDPSSSKVKLTVKSLLEGLNVAMPRTVFQPSCAHTVYSTGCGLSRAAKTVTGTASAGASVTTVPSNRAEPADYFTLGVLVFTTGANAGSRRAVRGYSGGVFTLATPLPAVPAVDDTFQVYPGCARTLAACTTFNNQTRFRGFPFVPRPENAR